MAEVNSTQSVDTPAFSVSGCLRENGGHYEKISCSASALSESELLALRGKRVRFVQRFNCSTPDSCFSALVMGVALPFVGAGISASLLLLEDGYSAEMMDYFDVSSLYVQGVE
ncbi:TPA: hypothetical protein ACPHWC_006727 [Pseudomonas aeruginosa]|uniref:hypothetical protein n=1 Tax=Pseudomonas aeruginosa TaxID=287 RepID=UPI001E3C3783|nr:hypothetical protein [Pseudomonas aeruginosa]EIU5459008.1 hypothetical protein [Pseudomonas aeruginosa]EIU5544160.1 hypothetical protein [Pseudomonas aeruginosa]EKB9382504.1 hypothetical protein [Pseudomonas aeruginosa]EKY0078735.1 hypothetical protein [Pseudomonas aeruginosa]EKY0500259.1 hypothetical protein [Pseudomonas aeruginosa]